jgi:hypothetical protein
VEAPGVKHDVLSFAVAVKACLPLLIFAPRRFPTRKEVEGDHSGGVVQCGVPGVFEVYCSRVRTRYWRWKGREGGGVCIHEGQV